MTDHLTPEEFFEFIDQGGGSGPAGQHVMDCAECLSEPLPWRTPSRAPWMGRSRTASPSCHIENRVSCML